MGELDVRGANNLNLSDASAQQRLDRLERLYILLDHSSEAIFVLEVPSGQVVEANRAARQLLACAYGAEAMESSLLGKSLRDAHGLGLEWFDLLVNQSAEDGERSTILTTVKQQDGIKPVELSVRWVRFEGDLYAMVVARLLSFATPNAPDSEWRAQQYETAAEVSRAALAILSMDELLPRVVTLIRDGFGFDYVGIFMIDDTFYTTEVNTHRWATLRAGTGDAGRKMMQMGYKLAVGGDSLVGRCLTTGQAEVAFTAKDFKGLEKSSVITLLPTINSAMALPLISRGRMIGAMLIQSNESEAFSEGDITVLKTMAEQLTIAIENARLFDQAQAMLLETRALYYASRVIAEATSIEQIVRGVARTAISLGFKACLLTLFTNVDASAPVLRGDAYGELMTSQGFKEFPVVKDFIITRRNNVRALMLRPDFVVAYGGPGASRMKSDEVVHDFKMYFGLQGGIVVALNLRGRPLGFLAFGGLTEERSFSLHQVHRVRTIGDRVSVAVDNVRLVASLGEEKARLESLYRLSQVISKSLDVYEVAQRALEEILRTLFREGSTRRGAVTGIVVIRDGATRRLDAGGPLRLIAAVGREAETIHSTLSDLHFKLGEGIVGWVAQERQSLLMPIVANDPRWRPLPGMGSWVQSLLSVPLMSGDELLGVLSVYSDRKASFNERHRQLVESAAATVAAAIANAGLFSEARHRAWEQSMVSRIVRALNALDIKQAFSALGRGLKELTGCDNATLALLNDQGDHLIVTRLLPQLVYEGSQLSLSDGDPQPKSEASPLDSKRSDASRPSQPKRPKFPDVIRIWEHVKCGKLVSIGPSAVSLNPSLDGKFELSRVLYGPNARAAISLPLLVSERVIGMLNLSRGEVFEASPPSVEKDPLTSTVERSLFEASPAYEASFSHKQISILRQVADAVAIAVEKHRLFQAEQGKRQEAETLREAALALTTSLDWDEVMNRLIEELQRAVPYDRASIQLLRSEAKTADGEQLVVVGGRGFADLSELLGVTFPADSDTPHREVIRTRKPFVVHNLQTAYANFPLTSQASDMCSWLGVPMMVEKRLLGTIALGKQEAHFYTSEHVRVVEALTAQAAVALENAQLFKETRRHAFEQEIVSEIVRSLNVLGLEPAFSTSPEEGPSAPEDATSVYGTVAKGLQTLTQCHWVTIVLFERKWMEGLKIKQVYPRPGLESPDDAERGKISMSREALMIPWDDMEFCSDIHEGEYCFVSDLADTPDAPMDRLLYAEGFRSRLSFPFTMGDRVLGVFNLAWRQPDLRHESRGFDRDGAVSPVMATPASTLSVLHQIANAMAFAVENSRLFQAEQQQRMLAESLWETALFVNSVLELQPLLRLILDQLATVLPYESGTIQSLEGDAMRVIAVRNLPGELDRLYPLDEYPYNQQLARGDGPIVIRNVLEDNRGWRFSEGTQHIRSNLGVPLWVRDHVIGALTIDSSQPNAYTETDVQVVQAFAQQAAIAIENVRLFEAEQKQRELAQALAAAATTVSSTLDLDTVLDRILEQLARVVKGDTFNVMLLENRHARIVRWRGHDRMGWVDLESADDMDITTHLISLEQYPHLLKMQRTGKSEIVPDTSLDPEWVASGTFEWCHAYMAAPILINDKVAGFINVNGTRPNQFGSVELQWLEAFANHAAIAIQNARMFQQLQDYNQELERRVREQTAQIHAHYTQLRAILNSSSDGIIVTDETGTIIDTNPVVDTLFEQQLSPADGEKLREVVREMSLSAAERPEKMLEFADVDLQLNAALIGDQGGKGASSVVMLHDISHLKALDRMKSRFVSDVSHELRTPVTTITLLISLLKRSPPERWEIYLDGLEQEAKRQSQLIHDILQVSRIDSGRLTLNVDYVNLEELAEDVILAHKVLAESRDLTLVYQRTGKRLIVSVDQAQISQVLNNLVENAIQYTPEGGQITVTTDRRHAEGQDWATLAVSDTGIGIPEHELQHIFERFYRGEQPRQKQISGTGLGLAIAKEILALHGGRVIVESQPNVGSTFVVWLPLGASRVE